MTTITRAGVRLQLEAVGILQLVGAAAIRAGGWLIDLCEHWLLAINRQLED